jgi:hypothetical protein
MRIPKRCALCGCVLDGWDRAHLLWGECNDCRDWQAYLWQQRLAQPVDTAAARRWVARAIAEAFTPYHGGQAV